jgi:hypothetical protein
MRGVRSFLVLLVLLAGLGGYALYEYQRGPTDNGDKRNKVFTVESDKIEEITIKAEAGDTTTLKKTGSNWQIVQPLTADTDGGEVTGILTNLSSLEVQRVIDENPGDLAEYGLAQPRIEITFKADGKEHRLQIGRKTPPGTDLYAKLADQKRVFLVSSYIDSTFNKTTFALRDKTVLKLDRDKVDTLAIITPKRTVRFSKADGEWKMTEPVKARADFTTVDGIVSRVNTLQMKSIVSDAVTDDGLDKPEATIQLGSGSSQATLVLGKGAGDGAVYAKDQSRPLILTIDSAIVAEVTKDAGEYRQKDLFDARTFNSTRLEIVAGSQAIAFEKTKTKDKDGKDEEKWKQVAPTAKDVDQAKIDALITAITQARATGFVDTTAKTGLDKPELTFTIKSDEGKREEKVSFARSGKEAFAARAGEPGAAKIDTATVESITKAMEGLK